MRFEYKSAFFAVCFISNVLVNNKMCAQSADSILSAYANSFPIEKIHVHTDREIYLSGDTIWFKAYLLANNLPVTVSTNLYVDLLDDSSRIVYHKAMPVIEACAENYFVIPYNSVSTHFTIQAFTPWMLNFDSKFIYRKSISIVHNLDIKPGTEIVPDVSVQFFAEGGDMVYGLYNYVAFKATQSNGVPFDLHAAVKNDKGELIDSIKSLHDGMGILKFTPVKNENYFAEWKDLKGNQRKTALPVIRDQGFVLHTEQVKNMLHYVISSGLVLPELNVTGIMNQEIVYQATIKTKQQKEVIDKFTLTGFPTGILQLTVSDKNNIPLAERILFVDNSNYKIDASVKITELHTNPRGRITVDIEVSDTVWSNLSMTVFDAGFKKKNVSRNIYTDMLLLGDFKGEIYNPDWYFDDTASERKTYLDLIMLTNGWRRYNLMNIFSGQKPGINYPRDNYLLIYGRVTDSNRLGKADEFINLIVEFKDSSLKTYSLKSDSTGLFVQNGLIFYDSARLFYSLNKSSDKNMRVNISSSYNGLANFNFVKNIETYYVDRIFQDGFIQTELNTGLISYINFDSLRKDKKVKLLSEVVVTSAKKPISAVIEKMDKKYPYWYKGFDKETIAIDVLHDKSAIADFDLLDYLADKIPGLMIIKPNWERSLVDESRNISPLFYIDEHSKEWSDYIKYITLEEIAYIKYYKYAYWEGGMPPPPAILLYRTQEDDKSDLNKKLPSKLIKLMIPGYLPVKEFYSPDYSKTERVPVMEDLRKTLYWQPYVLLDKDNKRKSISFYNNDKSKQLVLVLEGINAEGKMIRIEKIIE